MRVERAFSPIKIVIETIEDRNFFTTILMSAFKAEDRAWISKDSTYLRKLQELKREINL